MSADGNVWKLLLRCICVSLLRAILPRTCVKKWQQQRSYNIHTNSDDEHDIQEQEMKSAPAILNDLENKTW